MENITSIYVPMKAEKLARYVDFTMKYNAHKAVCIAMDWTEPYGDMASEADCASEFYKITECEIADGNFCTIVRYGGDENPFIHSLDYGDNDYDSWLDAIKAWFKREQIDFVHVQIASSVPS